MPVTTQTYNGCVRFKNSFFLPPGEEIGCGYLQDLISHSRNGKIQLIPTFFKVLSYFLMAIISNMMLT